MRADPFISILLCSAVIGTADYYLIPFTARQENLLVVIPLLLLIFLMQCTLGTIFAVCLPATFGKDYQVLPAPKAAKLESTGLIISLVTMLLAASLIALIILTPGSPLLYIISLSVLGFIGGGLGTALVLAGATNCPYEY